MAVMEIDQWSGDKDQAGPVEEKHSEADTDGETSQDSLLPSEPSVLL